MVGSKGWLWVETACLLDGTAASARLLSLLWPLADELGGGVRRLHPEDRGRSLRVFL